MIDSRMERVRGKISHWAESGYVVINDDVHACFAKVREVLDADGTDSVCAGVDGLEWDDC
ncbi:hypothetical protein K3152_12755 [Qipengyuania sp. 1NDH17]|uniref:Uncharacterized protein n=1 Tax=Qipengyuania polymorpha TaxID=2867234 RepID=A0ABS7IZX7_9SPHN|nr:hypothetical protein [Qipengyuania polymorpha]MBX7459122.1 hypothetical protein [Qipengyuania polymorpha]